MLMITFHETGSLWHHDLENMVKTHQVFVGFCKTCMTCMKHSASLLRQGLVRELMVFLHHELELLVHFFSDFSELLFLYPYSAAVMLLVSLSLKCVCEKHNYRSLLQRCRTGRQHIS